MDPVTGDVRPIRELVEGASAGGGQVVTLNDQYKVVAAPITARLDSGTQECHRVTLASGRTVVTTMGHPFLTAEGWRPLADLAAGAHVATPSRLPAVHDPVRIPDSHADVMAVLLSEGGYTQAVKFSTADEPVLALMERAVADLGGYLRKVGKYDYKLMGAASAELIAAKPGTCSCGCGAPLPPLSRKYAPQAKRIPTHGCAPTVGPAFLRRYGIPKAKAIHKTIPQAVFRMPTDQLSRFMAVFWMCDGYVTANVIELALGSKRMLEQIQHLLLRLGVQSRISYKRATNDGKVFDSWRLAVYASSIESFAVNVPLWGEKRARVATLQARTRNPKAGRPSPPAWLREDLRTRLKAPYPVRVGRSIAIADRLGLSSPAWGTTFLIHASAQKTLSAVKLRVLCETVGIEADGYSLLLSEDLWWDEIVSIVPVGPQQTYDLEVAPTSSFVANDIVVHNTYAAAVLAEELLDAGVPVVVVDPLGAWWGLKSNREGNGPGYPVVVFGGDHSDLPVDSTQGVLLAEIVVAERIPAILDLSHLSKRAARQLVADFLERLYEVNREVLHLIVDEADLFAPQRHGPETARMLGAMEDIVRRGRSRGLGVTLISQRPASVNKDVLTQVSVLLAMRMTGKQDVSAIDDWVRLHAEEDDARKVKATLGGLATGEGWLWSTVPGFTRLEEVRIRLRRTFDSSSTPKVGERRVTPTAFADLDLGRLAVLLDAGEVPEVSEVTARRSPARGRRAAPSRPVLAPSALAASVVDPRVGRLQGQVSDLKEQLAVARDELGLLRQERLAADRVRAVMRRAADMLLAGAEAQIPDGGPPREQATKIPKVTKLLPVVVTPTTTASPATAGPAAPRATVKSPSRTVEDQEKLPRAQEKILAVLARDGTRNTRQIALLTGYSGKSGGYRNALSALRTAGYITGRGELSITTEGEIAVGQWEQLPEGQALVRWWLERLGRAEREILNVVVSAWPNPISVPAIAEATGYSPTSGGFRNALSRLRTLGLAEGRGDLRADDTLGHAWNEHRSTG